MSERPTITVTELRSRHLNRVCDNCKHDWLAEIFIARSDDLTGNVCLWLCPHCLEHLAAATQQALALRARNEEAAPR